MDGPRYVDPPLPRVVFSDSFSFFQEELLNELLAEMKALRAVVVAQSQRIEVLERQLARIEDGDV